jgi:hypothetical protein
MIIFDALTLIGLVIFIGLSYALIRLCYHDRSCKAGRKDK